MSSYLSVVVGLDPSTTLRHSARAADLDNAIVHIHLDDGLDVSLIGSAADMTRLHTAIGEALTLAGDTSRNPRDLEGETSQNPQAPSREAGQR